MNTTKTRTHWPRPRLTEGFATSLPIGLIDRLHKASNSERRPMSGLVAEALEKHLRSLERAAKRAAKRTASTSTPPASASVEAA